MTHPPQYESKIIQIIAVALLLVSLSITGLAIYVAYYNSQYSIDLITRIFEGENTDREHLMETIPERIRPLMQDLSLVSPVLIALTGGWMALGAFRMSKNTIPRSRFAAPRFPFPRAYRTYYIQMGLLGTIVGFLIAFTNIDPRADRQSLTLLDALGTALWSTLTAIALAYALCPLVEVLYSHLAKRRFGVLPLGPTSSLDELRIGAMKTSDALDQLTQSVSSLGEGIDLQALATRFSNLERQLHEYGKETAVLHQQVNGLKAGQQELNRNLAGISAREEATTAQLRKKLNSLEQNLGKIVRNIQEAFR